ncbi:dienelactone hydrolase family protein [Massilia rhizosphaerae]|uniref:dienelactone hydrolase family protein n=1 Tax=Massilia rhizosphaerae TaxID=2784389 RepID=UPI0018DB6B40|nr:dienelactone hydrolase family protein [Massilia rhizosphaerae]
MNDNASGFAAAAQPIAAQSVIRTDTAGLADGLVKLTVGGQEVPVYYARPAGQDKRPVMIVVSEIFGLHEHIADVARRFAKQGYLALAPDFFVRQGDPSILPDMATIMAQIIRKVPDAQVMGDIDACMAWAADNGGDVDRLGVNGFCWGGRMTWLYAAHNPRVKAAVAWYGKLVADPNPPRQPRHPIDVAPTLTVPVLGLYGAKDAGIPLATVERMTAALGTGPSDSAIVVYPDAGHAFHADYRPSYNAKDARDGFARALAWFREHGAG